MEHISERVIQLEIDFGKITIISENISKQLISLEKLIKENQQTISEIKYQLEIRNERIKILKNIFAGLTAIVATVSGLHIRAILNGILS